MNNPASCLEKSRTWYGGHFRPEAKILSERNFYNGHVRPEPKVLSERGTEQLMYTTAVMAGQNIHNTPLANVTHRRFIDVYRPLLGREWRESDVLALFGVLQHRDENHCDLTVWIAFEKRPPERREVGHMTIIVPNVVVPPDLHALWTLERDPRTSRDLQQHEKYPLQRILADAMEAYRTPKIRESMKRENTWGHRYMLINDESFEKNLRDSVPSATDMLQPLHKQRVAYHAHTLKRSTSHPGHLKTLASLRDEHSQNEHSTAEHSRISHSNPEQTLVEHPETKQLSEHGEKHQEGHKLSHMEQRPRRQSFDLKLLDHNDGTSAKLKKDFRFGRDTYGERDVKKRGLKPARTFLEEYPNIDLATKKLFFAARGPIIGNPISTSDKHPIKTYGSRLVQYVAGNFVAGIYKLVHETHEDLTAKILPPRTEPNYGSLSFLDYEGGDVDISAILLYVVHHIDSDNIRESHTLQVRGTTVRLKGSPETEIIRNIMEARFLKSKGADPGAKGSTPFEIDLVRRLGFVVKEIEKNDRKSRYKKEHLTTFMYDYSKDKDNCSFVARELVAHHNAALRAASSVAPKMSETS